jgi:hypothetical protein
MSVKLGSTFDEFIAEMLKGGLYQMTELGCPGHEIECYANRHRTNSSAVPENCMQKNCVRVVALSFAALAFAMWIVVSCATSLAHAQTEKSGYPAMAPVNEYMMPETQR